MSFRKAYLALTLILAAWVCIGCSDKTAILVEVSSSDLSIPDDIDALRIEASNLGGAQIDQTFELSGGWPQSLAILPSDTFPLVSVTVTGLRQGEFRVRRVVTASFEEGQTRLVSVVLDRSCLGVECPSGVDCGGGLCVQPGVDAGPVDAGPLEDGGDRDGGRLDAGSRDGGGDGGSRDGGVGVDAGPDAGSDAGPVPMDAGDGIFRCNSSACWQHIVISEFRTGGPGGASDEFVELYNKSALPVDVQGLELHYTSSSGMSSLRTTITEAHVIAPGGYYLLGSANFVGPTVDGGRRWTTGFASSGGSLRLIAGGASIDLVGWGGAAVQEGTAIVECDTSCERKARSTSTLASMMTGGADADAGNGHDSDDNVADFISSASANPQNSLSPTEQP